MEKIIMSNKEMKQRAVFERLVRKEITQSNDAILLGITVRQVRRKLKAFREQGSKGLVHKNRGKESNKKWSSEQEHFAINLLKSDWHGFGPTFAAEKLFE